MQAMKEKVPGNTWLRMSCHCVFRSKLVHVFKLPWLFFKGECAHHKSRERFHLL